MAKGRRAQETSFFGCSGLFILVFEGRVIGRVTKPELHQEGPRE